MLSHHSWYVNDYQGQVESTYEEIKPISQTFPMNVPSNQITFQIPTGSYGIAIKESHLEYTTALTYHFHPAANTVCTAWLVNGIWWQQDYTVQAGTTAADIAPLLVASTLDKPQPYAVATGPLNSMVPFLESDFNYSSAKVHTFRIFDKTNYYQSRVSSDSSSNDTATWFFSDTPYNPLTNQGECAMFFDGRPFVITSGQPRKFLGTTNWVAAGGSVAQGTQLDKSFSLGPTATYTSDYAVTIMKQFKCPISYLSDIFAQDSGIFYANAVSQSWITLQLKFQQYDLAKIFGAMYQDLATTAVNGFTGYGLVQNTSSLTTGVGSYISELCQGNLGCAVTNMRLMLRAKASSYFTSDLQARDILAEKIEVCTWTPMQTISNSGGYNYTINQANKNVKDVMFTVSPNDTNMADSCAVHGLCTMFTAAEIIPIINGGFKNFASAYFYNMQMQIPYAGTTKNLINGTGGIQSLQMYKDITMGSQNLLNNPFSGPMALFDDNNYKLFQNLFILNTEQFKGYLLGDDVIQDGLNTRGRGIIFRADYIANYDPNTILANGNSSVAQAAWGTLNGYQTLGYVNGANAGINLNCYYFCEFFNIISPPASKMMITEDIEQFRQ